MSPMFSAVVVADGSVEHSLRSRSQAPRRRAPAFVPGTTSTPAFAFTCFAASSVHTAASNDAHPVAQSAADAISSKPTALPHWEEATPAQREMADKCVADIISSADDNAPGGLFNRATLKIRSMEDKQAVVPRVLNAMFERYEDPNAHNMELSQLNRAIATWTGYAVNYQVRSSGDAAKDKKERQSCIRQWFAFWRRYHKDLSEFIDSEESLDDDDGVK